MKRVLFLLPLICLFLALGGPARALPHTVSGAGDIIIDVYDELGQLIDWEAATVSVRLPGPDGVIGGFDVVYEKKDGTAEDDDGSMVIDGDVEFDADGQAPADPNFAGYIADGQQFRVTVEAVGYATWTQDFTWNSGSTNIQPSACLHTVKVTAQDEFGTTLSSVPGITVYIQGGMTVTDGDANDRDGTADGVIHVAQDPSALSDPASTTVVVPGFLTVQDGAKTIDSADQEHYQTSHDYGFVITADDELGADLTLTSADVNSITGLNSVYVADDSGSLYWAATGGPSAITLTINGFIATDTASTYTYDDTTQQAIDFDAAGDGGLLEYNVKVLGATDELGNHLGLATATISATSFTIYSQQVSGAESYIAAESGTAGSIDIAVSGYVSESANVTPDNAAQQTIAFDDGAEFAAGIDDDGLLFAVTLTSVQDEAGNAVVMSASDTLVLYDDSNCAVASTATYEIAPFWDGGTSAWYSAIVPGTYYAMYMSADYVATCDTAGITTSTTAQVEPVFTMAAGTGLKFPLKVLLADQLGNATNTATLDTLTFNGVAADYTVASAAYWATTTAATLRVASTGYVNTEVTNTGLAAAFQVATSGQTIINYGNYAQSAAAPTLGATNNYRGLEYLIMVTGGANVYEEELGNQLTLGGGETIEVCSDTTCSGAGDPETPVNQLWNAASGSWFIAPSVDGVMRNVVITTAGFLRTADTGALNLDPAAAQNSPAWNDADGDGLPYQIVVNGGAAALESEIGTALTLNGDEIVTSTTNSTCTATETTLMKTYNSNAWYIAPNTTATQPRYIAVYDPGFIESCDGDGVTVSVNTQVSPAWTQAGSDGLPYMIKAVDTVGYFQDEIGNDLSFDGTETLEVCTSSDCSATQTPTLGPSWDGTSWYIAPKTSTGSKWIKMYKSGYVATRDGTTISPNASGPQAIPGWTMAAGDGLKYALKVTVADELGFSTDVATLSSITFNTAAPDYSNSNMAVWATSTAGILAMTTTGYVDTDVTNTGLTGAFTPATSAQTLLAFGNYAQNGSGPTIGTTNYYRGLEFIIRVIEGSNIYEEELGNQLTLDGSETIEVCSAIDCSNPGDPEAFVQSRWSAASSSWFVAPGATGMRYVRITPTGFVRTTDSTQINVSSALAQQNPVWNDADGDGIQYQIRVNGGVDALESELDDALTVNNNEIITVTNSADCTATETPRIMTYDSNSWYIAPASMGLKYLAVYEPGFNETCESAGIIVDQTAQRVPTWRSEDGDGLPYQIKVVDTGSMFQEEFGNDLSLDGTESMDVCNASDCAAPVAPLLGPTWDGAAWYVAPASTSTTWIKMYKTGYVDTIDGDSISPTASGPQVMPQWTQADGDGLKYPLRVNLADELGTATDVATLDSITFKTAAPDYSSSNIAAWATDTNGALRFTATGYANTEVTNTGLSPTFQPATNAQTILNFGNYSANAVVPTIGSSTNRYRGLQFLVRITGGANVYEDELGNQLTLNGGETVEICALSDCSGAGPETPLRSMWSAASSSWFIAPSVEAARYVRIATAGFVRTADNTQLNLDPTAGQENPDWNDGDGDGLLYQIKITGGAGAVESEVGTALTLDGDEAVMVTTAAGCAAATETPAVIYYDTNSWYIAPATTGNKWVAIQDLGFIETCDGAAVNATDTAQVSPAWSDAAGDGLIYQVRVDDTASIFQDEVGQDLTLDGTESMDVCTDGTCSGTEAPAVGPDWDAVTASWYIAPSSTNSRYIKMYKSGYVDTIDSAAVTPAASGPQVIPQWTQADGDGLKFPLKVYTYDELDTAVNIADLDTITFNSTAPDYSNTNIAYWATDTSAALRVAETGYVNTEVTNNGLSAAFQPATNSQTVITYGNYAQSAAAPTIGSDSNYYRGLEFLIRITNGANVYEDELGNQLTLDGGETVEVCSAIDCSNPGDPEAPSSSVWRAASSSWFVAPGVEAARYVRITTDGFVQTSDSTQLNLDPTTAQETPDWNDTDGDGLLYQIKIDGGAAALETETGTALTLDGDEGIAVTTVAGCAAATETPAIINYATNAWYIAPATTGNKWIAIYDLGFIQTCDGSSVTAATTGQVSPAWTQAGTDGLPYQIKVVDTGSMFQDEFGTDLSLDGTESMDVCTDGSCSGTEAPVLGPEWDAVSSAWYIAPSSTNSRYIKMYKTGYVDSIDSTSVTPSASGPQVIPDWTMADTDGMKYPLKINVYNELGTAMNIAALDTATFNSAAPDYTSANMAAWATSTSAQLRLAESGYVNNEVTNSGLFLAFQPATNSQTVLTYGNYSQSAAAPTIGSTNYYRGLEYLLRITGGANVYEDELDNQLTLYGTEEIEICTSSACTNPGDPEAPASSLWYAASSSWFIAPSTEAARYIRISTTGFVSTADSTMRNLDPTTAQDTPDWDGTTGDGLKYQIKVTGGAGAVESEIGSAITLDGDESVFVTTDAACTATETPGIISYQSNAWYIAPASTGTKYMAIYDTGFIESCDGTSITASTASQQIPAWTQAGSDALLYQIRVDDTGSSLQDEFGTDLAFNGAETLEVCTAGDCSSTEAPAMGPEWDALTTSWYIAPSSTSAAWMKLYKTGYVDTIDGASIAPAASGPQVMPAWTSAGSDGLKYPLKINIADEFGTATDTTGMDTLTFRSIAPTYETGNTAVWATSTNGFINIRKSGFIYSEVTNSGLGGAFQPATSAQTVLNLGAYTANTSAPTIGSTNNYAGLQYLVMVSGGADKFEDELGNQLTLDGDETIAVCAAFDCSSGGDPQATVANFWRAASSAWYVSPVVDGNYYIRISEPGYVQTEDTTQLSVTSNTTRAEPAWDSAAGDGLPFQILISSGAGSLETEIGAAITADGAETVTVCLNASCGSTEAAMASEFSGTSWYIAPATTGEKYIRIQDDGFIETIDSATVTASISAQVSPAWTQTDGDGLMYQVTVEGATASIVTELGYGVALDGGETITVCTDASCSSEESPAYGPTWDASTSKFYIAPATTGNHWIQILKAGYTQEIDDAAINVNTTTQSTPAWTTAGVDDLDYTIKVDALEDELDYSVGMGGTDTVKLYSDSVCSTEVTPAVTPVYSAGGPAWYLGHSNGDYYVQYRKQGYVYGCAAAAGVSATGTTVMPDFTYDTGAPLEYPLVVELWDMYSSPVTGATLAHGGTSPAYGDMGTNSNLYYFNTWSAAGLTVSKSGYETIDAVNPPNSVEPGGAGNGRTYLKLMGENGNIGTIAAAPEPGAYALRGGLEFQTNVGVYVQYATSTPVGISGLGNTTNFYFESNTGNRVYPEQFGEVDPVNQPGFYKFKVATSTRILKIKDVDFDDDPWIDLNDSAEIDLSAITENYQFFGTHTLYAAADHVKLTAADGALTAGMGTEKITVEVYDNDGQLITAGPASTTTVSIMLSGGSVNPASMKRIISGNLTGQNPDNTSLATATSTEVTGALTSGTGNIYIADSVETPAGEEIIVAASAATKLLPQNYASNTQDLEVEVTSVTPTTLVMTTTDATTDATASVQIETYDSYGNFIAEGSWTITVTVSGSATVTGATDGSIDTGINTGQVDASTSGGKLTLSVRDTVAETIQVSADSTSIGDTASGTIAFTPGAPDLVEFSAAAYATTTAGMPVNITCYVRDAGGNLVTNSNDVFTITAQGASDADSPAFATPTIGTALSGIGSNQVAVRSASGTLTIPVSDDKWQTVTLSLSDSDGVGYSDVSDTATINFVSDEETTLVLLTSPSSPLTAGTPSTKFEIGLQDQYGNTVTPDSDVTINLQAFDTTTGEFRYPTSTSSSVSSVTISAGAESVEFYFYDTTATDSGSDVTLTFSAVIDSLQADYTVIPTDPYDVTALTVSTTTKSDPDQLPADVTQSYVQQVSEQGGSTLSIIDYPYTQSSGLTRITADGAERGIIRVRVYDKYGNAISGESIEIEAAISGSSSNVNVTPATQLTTDSSGFVEAYVAATTEGKVDVTIDLLDESYNYGESFSIYFKTDDRVPPTIEDYIGASDDYHDNIIDGDYVDPDEIRLHVSLSDAGVGVDLSSIEIVVRDSGGIQVAADTGSPDTTGCTAESDCEVKWSPSSTVYSSGLPAGKYTVQLSVDDYNQNEQTMSWEVEVAGGSTLKEVFSGPGIFDPRSGEPTRIAFQIADSMATVTLEIYNRSGKLVHMETKVFTEAGYNEFTWDGTDIASHIVGNGIYAFRIVAVTSRGTTSKTGKLTVFKQ